MMKHEFEERLGKAVSDDDYKVIEYIYMYHPVIDNVKGKQQIADLYRIGGMGLMSDMLHTAKAAERLERRIRELNQELETVRAHMNELKNGVYAYRDFEKEA